MKDRDTPTLHDFRRNSGHIIAKYLDYFAAIRSENTAIAYAYTLLKFENYLKEEFRTNTLRATTKIIRTWIVEQSKRNETPAYTNSKINALRSFYKFLVAMEYISINPTTGIRQLRTPKRIVGFISELEMKNILSDRHFKRTFSDRIEQIILEILYGTGMRLGEPSKLKLDAIDLKSQTIKVCGKGNKERIIPFTDFLARRLANYIKYRAKRAKPGNSFLIVNARGNACSPRSILRIVKKRVMGFTATKRATPHIFRHSYATHLSNRGANLFAIKDLLGHSSLMATQIYTHVTTGNLKAIFERAHPRA